jgi:hypothetical protein
VDNELRTGQCADLRAAPDKLTVVIMRYRMCILIAAFCDMPPCVLVYKYRRFGGACCYHRQGGLRKVKVARCIQIQTASLLRIIEFVSTPL